MENNSSKKSSTPKSKISRRKPKEQITSNPTSTVETNTVPTPEKNESGAKKYIREDLKCLPEDCNNCHNTCCTIHQGFPGDTKKYVREDLKCLPEDCNDCHNVCCPVYQGCYDYFNN